MRKNVSGGMYVVIVLALCFSCACKNFRTGVDPDPLPVILTPDLIPTVLRFIGSTPEAGAEIRPGDQVSLKTESREFENGTLTYALVLIRDDGQEIPFTCGGSTGGGTKISNPGRTVPAVDKFWVAGHRVNAALIANFDSVKADTGSITSPPPDDCNLISGQFPNGSINWEKVQYRSDIPLNWQIMK